jgi:transcriptional regulator with XRE-family HTH domain
MPKKETLQERLVRLRKIRGLTQQELSDATGISRRAVAHYETAGRDMPPDIAIHVANALNVTVDELFGHKPVPKQDFIKSRKLFRKFKAVEEFPRNAQDAVVQMIEGLEAKHADRRTRTSKS